ncbi:copper resistance CopC family protein [Agrococcus sp. ARC_14]|uniref:copper resistance CopC family protein n=1 Tax=Agrococcus sp. ARC_14 TaxID=2919927 RepID=UPI001F05E191|nr:copper resistance CopC family protein [Agrococcus sp. ARC_14]MCH1883425.1 copper resistance protein CopC [Agrococcus sp. ARC_14]
MLSTLAVLTAVVLLPAHASLIGSTPADGDVLTEQPGTFSVVMNEEILSVDGADSANAMQITDAAGLFYGTGCLTVDGDSASLEAELGEAGDYSLTFQVVSADGHPVSDTIDFSFDPAAGEAGQPGVAAAPVCGAAAPGTTDESVPATASADQGQEGDAAAPTEGEDAAGSFPFIAIGVLALLAVLAVIAYRANRLRNDVKDRDPDDEA